MKYALISEEDVKRIADAIEDEVGYGRGMDSILNFLRSLPTNINERSAAMPQRESAALCCSSVGSDIPSPIRARGNHEQD